MRKLLVLLTCFILLGCGTSISCKDFFSTVSTKDIPDISMDTVLFRTDYINGSCTSYSPLFDYNIKYDTLSRYKVFVWGRIFFGNNPHYKNQYKSVDSVEINSLVIDRLNSPREFFSDMKHKWKNNTPWEQCPLPPKILKKIKNDFLKRMKYTRYVFKEEDENSVSESYLYILY